MLEGRVTDEALRLIENLHLPALAQVQLLWALLRRLYADPADSKLFDQFPGPFNQKPNPVFDFDQFLAECRRMVEQGEVRVPKPQEAKPEPGAVTAAEFVEATDKTQQ